jgi:hypothetical protein
MLSVRQTLNSTDRGRGFEAIGGGLGRFLAVVLARGGQKDYLGNLFFL